MLPKKHRLTGADFKRLRRARVIHAPHFFLRVADSAGVFKAAAVVSSAVAKKATERNRLRRRVYTVLRRLRLAPSLWVVVTAKKGAAGLSFREAEAELRGAFSHVENF